MCLGPQHYYYVRQFKHLKHLDCTVQHIVCVHSLFLVFMKKVRQINTHTLASIFKQYGNQNACCFDYIRCYRVSINQLKEYKKKHEKHANNQRPIYVLRTLANDELSHKYALMDIKEHTQIFPSFSYRKHSTYCFFPIFGMCFLCFPYVFQLSADTATFMQQLCRFTCFRLCSLHYHSLDIIAENLKRIYS